MPLITKRNFKNILFVFLVALSGWVLFHLVYQKNYEILDSRFGKLFLPSSKIYVTSSINFSEQEREQIMKSVDVFMNTYKLPKGANQNSYSLLIDERINDAIKVITNPDQPEDDSYAVIFLRKISGVWQVDSKAGPWCTLAEFEKYQCE